MISVSSAGAVLLEIAAVAAPKFAALIVASSAAKVASDVASSAVEVVDSNVVEAVDIKKLVNSRFPDGFTAYYTFLLVLHQVFNKRNMIYRQHKQTPRVT
ncbi:ribonucleoside-diphosphate reductase subunit beta [Striga asiatica]|uniref:Ribonucleoside-diphosphate reductase subunit beta n=1 Tax=Striga asiatica TaxID=4170 RepID=A0A5A7QNZ0_STRAF|nr:ribonucleoside-diphosphate reductase subunit beta [Striga asiatica]